MLVQVRADSYPEAVETGTIKGVVLDEDGQTLPGAGIILPVLNMGTVSAADGAFEFKNLRTGSYVLQVSHLGYASESRQVNLASDVAEITIVLSPTHIELREIVVQESATGMVQPEKSLSITVANRDFFAGASSLTFMQSLQRIPGINAMDIGTGISKPVIRGLGFNRLVVAQNNIKQQGQQWGADHGLEIDAYDVERVEILKGPASLIFGSDAIGGALNIRPAVVAQENSLEAEAVAVAHSNNDLIGGSVMTALNREGRFARFRVSYQDFADYRVPADEFVYNTWIIPIADRRLKNTSGNDLAMSLTAGIRKSWGISSISVSNFNQVAGFFPASHGIPNPGSLLQTSDRRNPDFPRQEVNHFKIVSNTNWLLGAQRIEFDLGFQQNHRQELNPPHRHGAGPLPESNLELELILDTYSSNIKYHHRLSENQSLLVGLSSAVQQNRRGGYNFLLPDYRQIETGLFSIYNQRLSQQVFLNAGVRVDASLIDIKSFQEPVWLDETTQTGYRERSPQLQRSFFNLAFSSGISWIPTQAINVKFNAGSSFRNPTPIELSANGIHHGSFRHEMGDTSLQAERAWQLDAGFTWQLEEFYLHLSPFVNYFPNLLFLNPSGQFSTLQSAGQIYRFQQAEALHLGGEIYTDWHITHELHTSVGAEWVWAQNLDNNYPLPFTPPAALVGELNYSIPVKMGVVSDIHLISSLRSAAAQNRVARNEPATGAYTLTNIGLNFKLNTSGIPIQFLFMVNNLFDIYYKNHLSFYRILELPEPGRNFTLKITTSLAKRAS